MFPNINVLSIGVKYTKSRKKRVLKEEEEKNEQKRQQGREKSF